MNGSCDSPGPILCGCCEGIATETPEPISNRPGLSAIGYRVGTHTTFLASLLAALSGSSVPALIGLTTRDPSDFSIALLDAWATCLDILTFYQERIANESYLRTAVDAASVFSLAQLVGYKPSPGVGASAFLAFTLTSAPGSPDNVLIPAATRVQSVPAPGQSPQVFETSSDITALIAQNAIPPQTTIQWGLNPGDTSIWLQGTSNNINVGDALLFITSALHTAAEATSASGTGSADLGPAPADFHYVTSVTIDSNEGNTLIAWDLPLNWPTNDDDTASIYVFRKKAALFGSQAPDPRSFSVTGNGIQSVTGWPNSTAGAAATSDWSWQFNTGSLQLNLDSVYAGLTPPENGEPLWIALSTPFGLLPFPVVMAFQIVSAVDKNPLQYTLTGKCTQLTLANGVLPDIIQIATFSGDTPAEMAAIEQPMTQPQASFWLAAIVRKYTRSATVYIQSTLLTPADPPYIAWSYDGSYARQTGLLKPLEGTVLEVVTGEQLSGGQPVAVSGKRLRLQVAVSYNSSSDSDANFVPNGATGSLPLAVGQIFLVDAFPPTAAPTGSDQVWSVLTTDGLAGTLTIASGNVLLLPSDKSDPVTGETALISQVAVTGPIVALTFAPALARIYDRNTVSVNANVVAATQGETQNEIMGSGDATNAALQFTLKQAPLTYVISPLNNGAVSTLQVWVNNMQWHEVGNFLDSGATDRVFITQTDASQNVTVQFGDGIEGERTPTGQMNIRAVYRKGIGSSGNLLAGQLSQALDRPQGLSSVTNPDPSTGGNDPDTASDARASAPLQVLTLGRVVSLEDYQNYALASAGIAKALATWTWSGSIRGVFLTVAGANGDVFQPDDLTLTNLKLALWGAGNPYVPIQIVSYKQVLFEVGASVLIDQTNYDPTQVLAQVWQTLSTSFSFSQQQLGQGVAQSEVIALIQQTPGVIAVELNAFNRQGDPPAPGAALQPVLTAASPTPGEQGTPTGAEMLLLDPASQGNFGVWS